MWLVAGVCVGKYDPVTLCVRIGLYQRIALTNPACGRFATLDKFDVRVATGDFLNYFARFVCRAVINYDDFRNSDSLALQEIPGNGQFFVSSLRARNDHRDERQLLGRNNRRTDSSKACRENMRKPSQAHD